MDHSQIRPLKAISLKTRPLAPHALAWSCDGELAVSTDELLYIYLPEYPRPEAKDGSGGGGGGIGELADRQPQQQDVLQFSMGLQAAGEFGPDPAVNAQLCALHGIRLPPSEDTEDQLRVSDVPGREVTGSGGSLNQLVRLEWSPNGLGANLRPVLMAMLTSGHVLVIGEEKSPQSPSESGLGSRNTKMFKILWGLGCELPIPSEDVQGSYRTMDERISSFSWAKELLPGRALLAYATDESEVVIMSVQRYVRKTEGSTSSDQEPIWQVAELVRFDAKGPHKDVDPMDPDYVPHQSAFSLSWSPWATSGDSYVASLSYISRNYVGFRRVSINRVWTQGKPPQIEVDNADSASLCLFLSSDAFAQWENKIWTEDRRSIARGVICTPFEVKPFQVDLELAPTLPLKSHSTAECGTSYPQNSITNPIVDIIIHHPDPANKTAVPLYSLVRASATAANQDWFETNLPKGSVQLPHWVERITQQTTRLIPREAAPETLQDESEPEDGDDDFVNEFDEEFEVKADIHPYRFRFWAFVPSPGGGSTTALVSQYSNYYPHRRGFSRILFTSQKPGDTTHFENNSVTQASLKLTTEGKVWEWMYGGGPQVPGVTTSEGLDPSLYHASAQSDLFQLLKTKQNCVFCDAELKNNGTEARCRRNHSFATCTSSGLAILAPGVSRVCTVCQRRCLKDTELIRLAREWVGPEVSVPWTGDACGACGGKFVA